MEEMQGADEALEGEGMGDEMGNSGDYTPEELEAAEMVMKARKQRLLAKARKTVNINTLLSEIQMLAQHTNLTKGLDPKKASKSEVILAKALGDVRFVMATEVLKNKFVPEAVRGMARLIKEQGVFAPGGDFMDAKDDKVSGDTDVASTNVTGADKQPVYADSAEGPKGGSQAASKVMTDALAETARLPQAGELDEFGKSKKADAAQVMKSAMVELAKSFDAKMNEMKNVVHAQAKTIESLKNQKGISKSRNNGRMELEKSGNAAVFNGLFTPAVDKANSKM
jgi:hypothetical protein